MPQDPPDPALTARALDEPELVAREIHAITREILAAEAGTVRDWVREDVERALQGAAQPALRDAARDLVDGAFGEDVRAHLEGSLKALVRDALEARLATNPARALGRFGPTSTAAPLPPVREHVAGGTEVRIDPALLERELPAYVQRDGHPLPTTEEREGYCGPRHYDYWLGGLQDYLQVKATLRRHGAAVEAPFALLDLGCASGRVLRHFLCQEDGLELWGAEIDERHVHWILKHLPRAIRAFQCTSLPFLALPDEHFDCVTAFSVFTHIDEFETAWLAELRRVLKPGGIAYLTAHTDHTWKSLRPGMAVYDELVRLAPNIVEHVVGPELFQGPMPHERTVFRWHTAVYNHNVFHSEPYLRRVWGNLFEVLEIVRTGSGYQDVVVLRKEG